MQTIESQFGTDEGCDACDLPLPCLRGLFSSLPAFLLADATDVNGYREQGWAECLILCSVHILFVRHNI